MPLLLPLLLAGALVTTAAPVTSPNDDAPRTRKVALDTTAHRRIAASLVERARKDAEDGQLYAARAGLLTANTMYREAGGLNDAAVYNLVNIDYALDRYAEAADLLSELAEQAKKDGNITLCARATADAAELYQNGGYRAQAVSAVTRLRALAVDPRTADADRALIKKRLG